MRGLVVGSHRRQRSSPRSGRGAAWVGLFLLLAVIAVLASRGLWSGLVADLLNLGPQSAPQASILWQVPCAPASLCSVNSDGRVLLVSPGGGGEEPGGSSIGLSEASDGVVVAIANVNAAVLAAGYFDPGLGSPLSGRPYGIGDWRVIAARGSGGAGGSGGDGGKQPTLLCEDVLRLEPTDGEATIYQATDSVVTAACAWADEAEVVLGLYDPGLSGDPKGVVVAVGSGGETLWSHVVGSDPVHRVAARPGTGFVAAATPTVLALFDSHGNLLWSKSLRRSITDLALQSRGGPVVIAGGSLLVYDRRGNLIWRKQTRTPFRAVACAAEKIAVALDSGVAVYDEDGLERWSLACASAPVNVGLDPGGDLVAAVLDAGTLVLAKAPGAAPSGARAGGRARP